MPKKPRVVILDVMALAHRAFHAFSQGGVQLRSPSGEPTSATYGFARMLLQIIKDLKPDYIVATTDTKEPTFRHTEYTEYKATRKEADEDLITQLPRIRQLLEAFSVPYYIQPGFEADDLIGSLSHRLQDHYDVYIASGDQDLLQLVGDNVKIYAPKHGSREPIIYDREWLHTNKGIAPHQVIDYKALVGDPSDNIPGVTGIGPKTALELLQKYGHIDKIYQHLDEIRPAVAEKLRACKDNAYMSHKLATIVTSIDLKFDPTEAGTYHFDRAKIEDLFNELHFKSLLKEIPNGQATLL